MVITDELAVLERVGDKVPRGRLLYQIVNDNPPTQLLLGSDALKHVTARTERLQEEIDAWKSISLTTDG